MSMAAVAREVITGFYVCGLRQHSGIATELGYPDSSASTVWKLESSNPKFETIGGEEALASGLGDGLGVYPESANILTDRRAILWVVGILRIVRAPDFAKTGRMPTLTQFVG
jgi:hypothetical protein